MALSDIFFILTPSSLSFLPGKASIIADFISVAFPDLNQPNITDPTTKVTILNHPPLSVIN